MNILDLDDDLIEYKPREESDTSIVFYLEPRYRLKKCPKCRAGELNRNGYARNRKIRDTNFTGKFIELNIRAPRYQCGNCKKTTTHPFESIHSNHGMTKRLVKDIQKKTLTSSYVKISCEYGYRDNQTIKRIGDSYLEELNELPLKTPEQLAILVIKMKEKFRLFFIDMDTYSAGPSLIDIQKKINFKKLTKVIDRLDTKKIELVLTEPEKKLNRWVQFNINNIDIVNYGPSVLRKNKEIFRSIFNKLSYNTPYYLSPKELESTQNTKNIELLSKEKPEFTPYYDFYLDNLKGYDKVRGFYKQLATTYCVDRNNNSLNLFKEFFDEMTLLKDTISAYDAYIDKWDDLYADIKKLIQYFEKQGNGYSYDALRNRLLYGTSATKYPVFKKPSRDDLISHMTFGTPIPLEVGFHVPISELLQEMITN